jgi:SAM-dependent methyltransferase
MPLLERRIRTEKLFGSDEQFNQLYPLSIQSLARRHWTPLSVARKAANFLAAETGARVLDIGSGVGKFCMAAAYYKPNAHYHGIEQRSTLIGHAKAAREILGFDNVIFTQGNFTKLDFDSFDHFYFYNSFYENLIDSDKIDDSIDYSGELYNYYTRYLYKQLEQKSKGTRIATFHSLEYEIPPGYHEAGSEFDDFLKFWIKVD